VTELHALYERLTGNVVTLTIGRMDAWQNWARQIGVQIKRAETPGLTLRLALQMIVEHRQKVMAAKPNTLAAVLRFRHLVEQPDYAEEDLSDALRQRRAHRATAPLRTDKASVLQATGRAPAEPAPDPTTPEVVARLLAELKAAAR
jgi:hypothetical protein